MAPGSGGGGGGTGRAGQAAMIGQVRGRCSCLNNILHEATAGLCLCYVLL